MYNKILVPVDVSHDDAAKRILALGARLLSDGGRLTALHVMSEIPSYAATYIPKGMHEQQMEEIRAMIRDWLSGTGVHIDQVDILIAHGTASAQVLHAADEINPDLIIIGSHRPGLSDYFLGSTAARVVRHAQCSVLVDR